MAAKKAAKKAAQAVKTPGKTLKVLPKHKLTALQVDILCHLHETGRQHTMDDLKEATGASASPTALKQTLNKLKDLNLVAYIEHNDKWQVHGIKARAMKTAVASLRAMGGPLPAGELGAIIWGDPKKAAKDPKASTRYFAAASALLKSCHNIGVLYKMEQDGVATGYGVAV